MAQFKTPTQADFDKFSTIEEKMLFFLNDTVKYYSENVKRRASDGTACNYRMDKKACAIGRYLKKDVADYLDAQYGAGISKFYGILPPILKQFGASFLASIQTLHDRGQYWDKNGLTEAGVFKLSELKKDFNLNSLELAK